MAQSQSTDKDFHCILTNGKLTVDSDAPEIKGGLHNGFRPHELLEAALASCINITIRMTAKQKNIKLDNVEIKVEIDKTEEKSIFNYQIRLDDKFNSNDRDYFMNIIDFCAIKDTLTKQLEFIQNDW